MCWSSIYKMKTSREKVYNLVPSKRGGGEDGGGEDGGGVGTRH